MDYFHTISALHHKLLDYFTNGIGITNVIGTIIYTKFKKNNKLKSLLIFVDAKSFEK